MGRGELTTNLGKLREIGEICTEWACVPSDCHVTAASTVNASVIAPTPAVAKLDSLPGLFA